MVKYMQAFNERTKAWVKYKKYNNGKTIIVNVKQRNPMKKFKGITCKK